MKDRCSMKIKKYMTKHKEMIFLVIGLLLTIFYFSYATTITWDGAHYMSYVEIFEGKLPFTSWDVVRGPIFPLIIYLGNFFFGKTVLGLLINSYLYFLVMLVIVYKILDSNLPKSKKKVGIIVASLIAIIINPIIYGYYHTLLTEFVAMTLAVISCYLSYLWLKVDFTKKGRAITFVIIFSLLNVVSWFLKQPYLSVTLFPLLMAFLIRIFRKEKIRQKIYPVLTVTISLFILFVAISSWNSILAGKKVDANTDRNPVNSIGNMMVMAIPYFKTESYYDSYEEINLDDHFFDEKEREEIKECIDNNRPFMIVSIYDMKNKLIAKDVLKTNNGSMSMASSLIYIMKKYLQHPILLTDSYVSNYLAIADIYRTTSEDGVGYTNTKKFDLAFSNEITTIGMKPFSYSSNIFYLTDEAYARVVNYEQYNSCSKILNVTMRLLGKVALALFKVLFVLLPFTFIYSIVMRIKTKKNKYDILIILFGFGFLHILLHCATGSIIDRYAMPAYITTFIGMILLIGNREKREGR